MSRIVSLLPSATRSISRPVCNTFRQFFNRPGPRIVESVEILAEIIHPELFDVGHRGRAWVTA